jgi:hypothetical protein
MYLTLEDYLLKALRGPERRRWVSTVLFNQAARVEVLTGISKKEIEQFTPPRAAACLYLLQIKALQDIGAKFPAARSLDGNTFFEEPAETLVSAFRLFGKDPDDINTTEIIDSDIFSSYSKSPGLNYDPNEARRRKAAVRRRIAEELIVAREWATRNIEKFSATEKMARPLVGEAPDLFN